MLFTQGQYTIKYNSFTIKTHNLSTLEIKNRNRSNVIQPLSCSSWKSIQNFINQYGAAALKLYVAKQVILMFHYSLTDIFCRAQIKLAHIKILGKCRLKYKNNYPKYTIYNNDKISSDFELFSSWCKLSLMRKSGPLRVRYARLRVSDSWFMYSIVYFRVCILVSGCPLLL